MGAPFEPASESRGINGLAHELANLLQVVNGNLELLDHHVSGEPGRRYLGNARLAAEHLSELSRVLSARTRD